MKLTSTNRAEELRDCSALDESKEHRESREEYSDEYNTGESGSEYDNYVESEESEEGSGSEDDEDGISPIKPNNLLRRASETGTLTEEERQAVEAMKDGVHKAANPWTSRMDQGIDAIQPTEGAAGARSDQVYFCGIIDILQQYNTRKRAETFFKGFTQDSKAISCVDPDWYAKRFLEFIDAAIE